MFKVVKGSEGPFRLDLPGTGNALAILSFQYEMNNQNKFWMIMLLTQSNYSPYYMDHWNFHFVTLAGGLCDLSV